MRSYSVNFTKEVEFALKKRWLQADVWFAEISYAFVSTANGSSPPLSTIASNISEVCNGLGAAVRGVLHQGRLWAESRPANSSSFGSKPKNFTLI